MRRLAALAVVAALMSPAVASGQDYSFGDWARDQGYSPGDVMPDFVLVGQHDPQIDSLDGIDEFDWTTTPTTSLYLDHNQISSIESGDFSGLANLTTLSLQENQISSVESGDFSGLTNLAWLSLNRNQLSSIESGAFSGLTNLTELSLWGNQISSIESGAFNVLTNLEELYLSNNQLSAIESGAFSGLENLQDLNLGGNAELTELILEPADFTDLFMFDVWDNVGITSVSLRNTVVNQESLAVLLDGGENLAGVPGIGIGELHLYGASITEMDLSGIDFANITDLEPLYVMDDLTDLWLVDTQNMDAAGLDLLLDNLETIEGTDTEGVLHMTQADFAAFNTAGGDLLAVWNDEPGHHVEHLLIGDVNHDTEVNGLDVDEFTRVLLASRFDVAADMNGDGAVNGLDVDPFVAAVVGGAQSIPEPSTLLLCVALGLIGGWRKWKRATYAACVVLAMTSTLAGQTVVVNDNIEFVRHPLDPSANHVGIVEQVAAGDNYTDALFDYDGSNLTGVAVALDEGSDWYVVNPGDPFGFATLASGRFTPILTLEFGQTVFVGSNEFYLGVSTTSNNGEGITEPYCSPDEDACRNVFGWMRLRNVGGQLEMVDNAVAYSSLGIIVGTTHLVPEPSTLTLCALGLVGLLAWRRKPGQLSHV